LNAELLGLASPEHYNCLNQSDSYTVEGTDDVKDFQETVQAMSVIGLNQQEQFDILRVVAAILHLSNVTFVDSRNFAVVQDERCKEF